MQNPTFKCTGYVWKSLWLNWTNGGAFMHIANLMLLNNFVIKVYWSQMTENVTFSFIISTRKHNHYCSA